MEGCTHNRSDWWTYCPFTCISFSTFRVGSFQHTLRRMYRHCHSLSAVTYVRDWSFNWHVQCKHGRAERGHTPTQWTQMHTHKYNHIHKHTRYSCTTNIAYCIYCIGHFLSVHPPSPSDLHIPGHRPSVPDLWPPHSHSHTINHEATSPEVWMTSTVNCCILSHPTTCLKTA